MDQLSGYLVHTSWNTLFTDVKEQTCFAARHCVSAACNHAMVTHAILQKRVTAACSGLMTRRVHAELVPDVLQSNSVAKICCTFRCSQIRCHLGVCRSRLFNCCIRSGCKALWPSYDSSLVTTAEDRTGWRQLMPTTEAFASLPSMSFPELWCMCRTSLKRTYCATLQHALRTSFKQPAWSKTCVGCWPGLTHKSRVFANRSAAALPSLVG